MIKEKGIRSARGFSNKALIFLPASDAPPAVVLSFSSGPGGGREHQRFFADELTLVT